MQSSLEAAGHKRPVSHMTCSQLASSQRQQEISPLGLTVLLACNTGVVASSPRGMVIHFRGQSLPADYFYKVLLEHKHTHAFMFFKSRFETQTEWPAKPKLWHTLVFFRKVSGLLI